MYTWEAFLEIDIVIQSRFSINNANDLDNVPNGQSYLYTTR